MTSAVNSASDSRRPARRATRRDVVTFTMRRGAFRGLVFVALVGLGGAFGVGFFAGQTVDVGDRARAIAVAPASESAPSPVANAAARAPVEPDEVVEAKEPVEAPSPPPERVEANAVVEPDEAPIVEPDPPPLAVERVSPKRGYGLQLGAFETEADAERFVRTHAAQLERRRTFLLTSEVPGRGVWHRVRWGRFKTKRLARRGKAELGETVRDVAIVVSYR